MKPLLLVYHRSWYALDVMRALSNDVYEKCRIRIYCISTAAPDAPDLRLFDLGKLTKVEMAEVKSLIDEHTRPKTAP